jgi:hypothetical protein
MYHYKASDTISLSVQQIETDEAHRPLPDLHHKRAGNAWVKLTNADDSVVLALPELLMKNELTCAVQHSSSFQGLIGSRISLMTIP